MTSLAPSSAPSVGGGLSPPHPNNVPPTAAASTTTPNTGAQKKTLSRYETMMDQKVLLTSRHSFDDMESPDGRFRNQEASQRIRDTWIYKQIRLRQDEFIQYQQALVFVGTWNVNAKGKDESLEEWICADWKRLQRLPDIVIVGFQEIVDLNAVNVAVDNKTQQRSSFWSDRLLSTVNSQGEQYQMISQRSMVGLLLCLLVRKNHLPRIQHIHSSATACGVLGLGGNKGGVAIRMQYYDTTLCFICSHLAAHRENVNGRNQDFANILQKTIFDVGEDAVKNIIRNGSVAQWTLGNNLVNVTDHDVIIWLGDLNYRIEENIPTERAIQLAEKSQLDELLACDQLNIERNAGRCFQSFDEGPITFPPTYKYQPGTDVYDTRPEKKIRAPAWCDRILYRTSDDATNIQLFSYNRSERPNVSDHKAVYSTMQITIKDANVPKREAIYNELMRLLDRYENQSLPTIGIDRVNVPFGLIRYEESKTIPILITNTGSVVAQYRFVPKLDETNICKPWCTVKPTYGMLIPGEQPTTINITITLNKEIIHRINNGREVLDDVFILRLENGRDYYISINADYARSCYGMSLDELVLYTDPIRAIPIDPIARTKMLLQKQQRPNNTTLCVPKELWRLLDAMYEMKGYMAPNIFIQNGTIQEMNEIRECLDTGHPLSMNTYSVYSYADVLVLFLSNLAVPIISYSQCPTMEIDSQNIQMFARRLLDELPPIHYNVFVYVVSFLREVLKHQQQLPSSSLSSTRLARIACTCFLSGSEMKTNITQIGDESENNSGFNNDEIQKRTGMTLILLHLLETNSI